MHNRDEYLQQLIKWKDKAFIKVITGVRRCGKSSLMLLYKDYLKNQGVEEDRIIHMNFESMTFDAIENYRHLYQSLSELIIDKKQRYYILLDEVQLIDQWEKCINGLMLDWDVDIYITGSNAYLLSSELSTLLSGRYIEIKMMPLSFKEYLEFIGENEFIDRTRSEECFDKFVQYGGLPSTALYHDDETLLPNMLDGIFNSVIVKDIIQRNKVRDPALLEYLLAFMAANVGNIVSTKKISGYLTSMGRKTTGDTIDNYLMMAVNSNIIYKVKRYDIKGKMYLKTFEKYYMVDTGIRNLLTGRRDTDIGHVLENIVFLELIRRGYQVSIGKIGELEVDFVAVRSTEKLYVQVCATLVDESTRERELRSLRAIKDFHKRIIITKDRPIYDDYDGIRIVNVIDFLLKDE